ncbi:hypothetical protein [Oceanobacillus oncorhynchi]|uniref:hypothetical protein n=1 Tax=Oceanobacillus oncorhynchi TaxID=545501 RepID=UPI0034D4C93C
MLKGYRKEDHFEVLNQLYQIHDTCMALITAGKEADFDYKEVNISHLRGAVEKLKDLHQMKVEEDAREAEEKARQMF